MQQGILETAAVLSALIPAGRCHNEGNPKELQYDLPKRPT